MSDPIAPVSLNPIERRVTAVLAGVYGVRMLGLFLLLPVIALYAADMPGATPVLIGIVVGAYGLSQALLQVPFGMLSDRIGRKPVIVAGLLVFILGSVVAARADTIALLILGRTLQGAGAISAAITALLADHTRTEVRTRSMAFVGITIGGSFMVSLMLGPVLAGWFGVPGLFWLAAAMGIAAIALIAWAIPPVAQREAKAGGIRGGLAGTALRHLYLGIFVLHLGLTGLFVILPLMLAQNAAFEAGGPWKLYLVSMLVSLVGTVPLILLAERRPGAGASAALALAVVSCAAGLLLLATGFSDLTAVGIALSLFFAGFNFLEARMPAMLSILATADSRGAALGIYATCQFLGAFAGGALGGWLLSRQKPAAVYVLAAALLLGWWVLGRIGHFRLEKPHSGMRK